MTEANTAMEIAVVGPDTRCHEEPNSAATIAGIIAAYRPYCGGTPVAMASAMDSGMATMPTVSETREP